MMGKFTNVSQSDSPSSHVAQLKSALLDREAQVLNLQKQLSELRSQLQKMEEEVYAKDQSLIKLSSKISNLSATNREVEHQMRQKKDELELARGAMNRINMTVEKHNQNMNVLYEDLPLSKFEELESLGRTFEKAYNVLPTFVESVAIWRDYMAASYPKYRTEMEEGTDRKATSGTKADTTTQVSKENLGDFELLSPL